MYTPPFSTYRVVKFLTSSFCECRRLGTESKIWGTVGLEVLVQLYLFLFPPVASAPTDLIADQEGLTTIRVSWTPPTSLENITGYRIYYSGGSNGSVDVNDSSTDKYLLNDLQNGATYTIVIVSTSEHFLSGKVEQPISIALSELPQLVLVHRICGCPNSLQTQLLVNQM